MRHVSPEQVFKICFGTGDLTSALFGTEQGQISMCPAVGRNHRVGLIDLAQVAMGHQRARRRCSSDPVFDAAIIAGRHEHRVREPFFFQHRMCVLDEIRKAIIERDCHGFFWQRRAAFVPIENRVERNDLPTRLRHHVHLRAENLRRDTCRPVTIRNRMEHQDGNLMRGLGHA